MEKGIKKYYWTEVFDGGEGSNYFDTFEECYKDMEANVARLHFTIDEYKRELKRNGGSRFAGVYCVIVDEDGDIIDDSSEEVNYGDYIEEITINCDTCTVYDRNGYSISQKTFEEKYE